MDTETNKLTSRRDASVRNSKSGLFSFVFSQAEALVDLHRVVRGGEISASDIEHIDLDELLQRTHRYNDTAFRTKDNRLLVFFEHQSTLNENMPFRFLEYAVDTIRVMKVLAEDDRFKEKLTQFPRVEFYVAYNGKKKLSSDEREAKVISVDLGDIFVKATVKTIHFESLPEPIAKNHCDKVAGYAFFTMMFEKGKKEGLTPYKAFVAAVEESLRIGYLVDVWSRKECVDMFAEIYTYDDQLREEGREEGRAEGREEGREKGREEGLNVSARIIQDLKKGMPLQSVCEKYNVSLKLVEELHDAMLVV